MAKFRKNHDRKRGAESGGMIAKIGIFSLIIGVFYFFFNKTSSLKNFEDPVKEDVRDLEQTGVDSNFFTFLLQPQVK